MQFSLKKIGVVLGCTIVLISIYAFGNRYFQISKNLDIMAAAYREVNTSYVDETDPSKLMRNLIDGMLKTLDPYTNYFSQSQVETARMEQTGKFGGIGIKVDIFDGVAVITQVEKGLPAYENNLKPGDRILEIDGTATKGKSKDDIERFLRGQPNTTLNLKIEKVVGENQYESKTLNLTRLETQETNVPYFGMITDNTGVIRLKIFNENAARDVRHAFDSLKRTNPNIKSLILDLRGNPGGLLQEAVKIVNLFIPRNQLVVSTKGKVAEWNTTFKTLDDPLDTKIPVAVITDNMSASASEIVSGSLQDLDRGVVVGQRTYGKGLVQITKNLNYNTVLKVTTAKYYIPSGRCIQAINYAERNADGSVKHIPDSLKVAFKTKAGRTVYDGGGIDPDIVLPKKESSKIAQQLISKHLIFDFATQFALKNKTIASAKDFKLSESEFDGFLQFIKNKDYSYTTESENLLENLKEAAEEEKYFNAIKEKYEAIKTGLAHNKQQDVLNAKAEIKTLIEAEIVSRYYFAPGFEQRQMLEDERVAKALEILNNTAKYTEILSAKK
ncbi:MAG: S41 family peptidase [Chitinophagales bacterium]|nr:S41 family peptidase [Chitinophagales bacterium]HRP39657.1 S41 family peptidase [Chitinophagales bacterium]